MKYNYLNILYIYFAKKNLFKLIKNKYLLFNLSLSICIFGIILFLFNISLLFIFCY